jgi:Ca2+ transporting ATPase
MGNATTICSDKTGTLTKNKMTVVRVYTAEQDFKAPIEVRALAASHIEALALGFSINSDPNSTFKYNASGMLEQMGNKVRQSSRCCLLTRQLNRFLFGVLDGVCVFAVH